MLGRQLVTSPPQSSLTMPPKLKAKPRVVPRRGAAASAPPPGAASAASSTPATDGSALSSTQQADASAEAQSLHPPAPIAPIAPPAGRLDSLTPKTTTVGVRGASAPPVKFKPKNPGRRSKEWVPRVPFFRLKGSFVDRSDAGNATTSMPNSNKPPRRVGPAAGFQLAELGAYEVGVGEEDPRRGGGSSVKVRSPLLRPRGLLRWGVSLLVSLSPSTGPHFGC